MALDGYRLPYTDEEEKSRLALIEIAFNKAAAIFLDSTDGDSVQKENAAITAIEILDQLMWDLEDIDAGISGSLMLPPRS